MKQFFILSLLFCLVAPCLAAAAEYREATDSDRLEKALRTAFVLSLAEEMKLDEQQTLGLVREYQQQSAKLAELRQRQQDLRNQLLGEAQNTQSQLEQLMQLDLQLAEAELHAAQEVGTALSPTQRGRVYLLLSSMEEHVSAIMGDAKDSHKHATQEAGLEKVEVSQAAAAPDTQVMQAIAQWAEGVKSQKIDQMMAPFSDSFKHYEYGDKSGVREFLQQAVDMGYLEAIQVGTEEAEIEISGDEATVYPVKLNGSFGQATIEFTLKNEAGAWRIVGMDISGV